MSQDNVKRSSEKANQSIKCPQCTIPLVFKEQTVIVNDKGNRKAPVAYCRSCRRYYTNLGSLRNHKITFQNNPVRWLSQIPSLKRKKAAARYQQYEKERERGLQSEKSLCQTQPPTHTLPPQNEKPPEFTEGIILTQIPVFHNAMRKCPFCNTAFKKMFPIRYCAFQNDQSTIMHAYTRVCGVCQAIMMDEGQINEVMRRAGEKSIFTIKAEKYANPQAMMKAALELPTHQAVAKETLIPLPFEKGLEKTENLSSINKRVLIYAHNCHCHSCSKKYQRNTIFNRTAMVQTVSGQTIGVNVMFCAGCGRYYMNLKAFEQYRKFHKGLLFECTFSSDIPAKDSAWLGFAPDSILSRCGYNVKVDTDEEYRHAVLRFLLDSGKAKKYEIIEKLSDFIEIRLNRSDMADAIARWEADIHYVSQYQTSAQKKVYSVEFQQGGKIHR